MNPEFDPHDPASPPYRLFEEMRGVDGLLVSTLLPCEDPSLIPEAVPLPSPPDSLSG